MTTSSPPPAAVDGLEAGTPSTLPGLEVLRAPAPAAAAAGSCASLYWAIGWHWDVIPFLFLGFGGSALAVIDLRAMRLPDRILLPLYAVGIIGLAAASALGAGWAPMTTAAACMVVLYGLFFVIGLIGPMGGGDVKLAGVLGLYLGWLGMPCLYAGLLYGTLAAAAAALLLVITRRAGRRSALPYGPFLLGGAWLAILLHAR